MDEEEWPDAGTWEVFKPKDAAVLPITQDGDVLLIRQFHAGARSWIEEILPGCSMWRARTTHVPLVSCSKRPGSATRRSSRSWRFTCPGSSSELVHLFVAEFRADRARRKKASR